MNSTWGRMGKYFYLLISILIFFIFVACKNNTDSKLSYSEENTIKQSIKEKESNITWSIELESNRLLDRVNLKNNNLSDDVEFNMEVMKVLPGFQESIYPEFDKFGSLNTSKLKFSVKEKINDFCKTLSDGKINSLDSYFASNYIFNYVFFKKDLLDLLKDNFNFVFSEEESVIIFDKWILGEPFMGEKLLQIPVRFYCNQGFIDVTLYLNSELQNSIYQITLDRWEKV